MFVRAAALMLALLLLTACGQKGPLYLPGDPPADDGATGPAEPTPDAP